MMERAFRGVWIPRDLWLSTDLSLQEKVLLVEIDSLSKTERGCFASNDHFASFLGLSKERARKVIASLVSKGYVSSEMEYRDGTKEVVRRWLKVNPPYGTNQPHPTVGSDQESNTDIEKKEIPKGISKEKPTRDEVREYIKDKGYHFSPDEFFDYYEASNWHKSDGKIVRNWKQCCVTWESHCKPSQKAQPEQKQDSTWRKFK